MQTAHMARENGSEPIGQGGAPSGATLRRKLDRIRPPDPGVMSPAKAFRIALAKAAEEKLALTVGVLGVSEEKRAVEPFLESLADTNLLLVLRGPDGALAVAALDGQLIAALIEIQTMGRVLSNPAPSRPPTGTDAVLCRDFIDETLVKLAAELAGDSSASRLTGYEYAQRAENTRLLGLMLDDVPYRIFRIALDLAAGAKQGELVLGFPVRPKVPAAAKGGRDRGQLWHDALKQQVYSSRVGLEAVLHRMSVPLAKVRALKIGDLLPVPLSALSEVALEGTAHPEGAVRAHMALRRVCLGQQHGMRAVRMTRKALPGDAQGGVDVTEMAAPASVMPSLPPALGAPLITPPQTADIPVPDAFPPPADPMPDLPPLGTGDLDEMMPMAAMPMDIALE